MLQSYFPLKHLHLHHTSAPFQRQLRLPGDKSISHRAAILASIAQGTSTISGFLESEDCLATIAVLQKLGITIEHPEHGVFVIHGRGGFFSEPSGTLDCKNSGTTMRLLAGLLAAQPFSTTLIGDDSLSNRPMRRVMEPLSAMGAILHATGIKETPPLTIQGGRLHPIDYRLPMSSAQVKSAIILAALFTPGTTTIMEPTACRDHTERMLTSFQGSCSSLLDQEERCTLSVTGPQKLQACSFHVPGDLSSAAFWIVAAAARPGSKLMLENIGINPTRIGIISILERMGAKISIKTPSCSQIEPCGDITVSGASLKGTVICCQEISNVIDELPILAIAGALAHGTTIIRDAQELRVKETDRITALVHNLRLMGAHVKEYEDGLEIEGGVSLHGTRLPSYGDHRIAMAFAIAGLFACGETIIEDAQCINTSYPNFEEMLSSFTS